MENSSVIWQDISEWGLRYRIRRIDGPEGKSRYVLEHNPGRGSVWSPKEIPPLILETMARLVEEKPAALPENGLVLERIMLQGAAKLAKVLGIEVKNVGDLASIYSEAARKIALLGTDHG